MTGDVITEFSGQVAVATFHRPEARNAMTWDMYQALVDFCERVDNDPDIRVALLRGSGGRAFVAGTDIGQFLDFTDGQDGIDYERRIAAVIGKLENLRVPTIAVVDGYATGGGLIIAGVCDLRICTPNAKFGLPIARTVGNCLSMKTYARLVGLIGPARTLHMIYTAEFIEADEALRIGLASELVAEDGLDDRVAELTETLASHAPLTLRASKVAVQRLHEHAVPDGDDLISMCYGSEDFREGVRAFLDKRPPQWKAR